MASVQVDCENKSMLLSVRIPDLEKYFICKILLVFTDLYQLLNNLTRFDKVTCSQVSGNAFVFKNLPMEAINWFVRDFMSNRDSNLESSFDILCKCMLTSCKNQSTESTGQVPHTTA